MLKILFVSSSSACFELENDLPYYAESQYTVYLNGEEVLTTDTNVFSLFGLTPNTEYSITTSKNHTNTLTFKTTKDTCVINVKDFGAIGDGINDDSIAIQSAINCLPKGAKLYFPDGQYLTSPLCLKSHITIELSKGATILGHTDTKRYPVIPGNLSDMVSGDVVEFGTWEGNSVPMHQSLIFAEYAEDITIIGPGTVDGNVCRIMTFFSIKIANISLVMRVQTPQPLVACFATAPCMPWGRSAEAISPIRPTALRIVPIA